MIAPLLFLWAMLPNDVIAVFADWLFGKISTILLDLPFSRNMETEADVVGLEISSKACFDIREAPAFWAKMELIDKMNEELNGSDIPEFLSTHPSSSNRSKHLSDLLPKALDTRSLCGCNKLTTSDPMTEFVKFKVLFYSPVY